MAHPYPSFESRFDELLLVNFSKYLADYVFVKTLLVEAVKFFFIKASNCNKVVFFHEKWNLCPWATVYRMTIALIVGLIVSVQGQQNTAEIFLMGYRLLSTKFEIRNEINKQLGTQYGMDATYCSLFKLTILIEKAAKASCSMGFSQYSNFLPQ